MVELKEQLVNAIEMLLGCVSVSLSEVTSLRQSNSKSFFKKLPVTLQPVLGLIHVGDLGPHDIPEARGVVRFDKVS